MATKVKFKFIEIEPNPTHMNQKDLEELKEELEASIKFVDEIIATHE